MAPPDRRPRWRLAVYAQRPGMTNGCRVVLLFLADRMDVKGIVSVPRTTIADTLGVATPRISEHISLARELGFLAMVRRARQHVTAVYQATIPAASEVRQGVPLRDSPEVRQGVPPTAPPEVRSPGCLGGTAGRTPEEGPEVRQHPYPSSGSEPQGSSPSADAKSKSAAMTRTGKVPGGVSLPADSEGWGTVTDAPLPAHQTQPHLEPPICEGCGSPMDPRLTAREGWKKCHPACDAAAWAAS